ncbi:hypothetical protein MKX73_08975 [Solibacillus sp. FSL W7-1436]|uniref:hypothetical protein n=1 Tax=Solibacillus sp. FSL W7-1436 TaxID=2921705 RepID=UPI0030F53F3C
MKKVLFLLGLLLLAGCSKEIVAYDGKPLKIAVLGEFHDQYNTNIEIVEITFEALEEAVTDSTLQFDALFITPTAFGQASRDEYIKVYEGSIIPIVYYEAAKGHFAFTKENITYDTLHFQNLINGSHSTLYIHNEIPAGDELAERKRGTYVCNFYLNGDRYDMMLKEIYEKIETLI